MFWHLIDLAKPSGVPDPGSSEFAPRSQSAAQGEVAAAQSKSLVSGPEGVPPVHLGPKEDRRLGISPVSAVPGHLPKKRQRKRLAPALPEFPKPVPEGPTHPDFAPAALAEVTHNLVGMDLEKSSAEDLEWDPQDLALRSIFQAPASNQAGLWRG